MFHRNLVIFSLLLITTVQLSCGKSNKSSQAGRAVRFGNIDITDAKQLFVTGQGSQGFFLAGSETLKGSTLYKVSSSGGVVKEVTYLDTNGNPVTADSYPIEITSPDDRIVVFQFSDGSGYLVRKETGKAYLLGNDDPTFIGGFSSISGIQKDFTDDKDKIYFWGTQGIDGKTVVLRATFEGDNLVKTVMSASGDNVGSFANDKNGNLIYKTTSDNGDSDTKKRTSDGKFVKLSSIDSFWTTKKGHLITRSEKLVTDHTDNKVLSNKDSTQTKIYFPQENAKKIDLIQYSKNSDRVFCASVTGGAIDRCGGYNDIVSLTSSSPETSIAEASQSSKVVLKYDVSGGFIQSKLDPTYSFDVYANGSMSSDPWNSSEVYFENVATSSYLGISVPFACRTGNLGIQFPYEGSGKGKVITLINEDDATFDVYGFSGFNEPVCTDSAIFAIGEDESIYRFDIATKTSKKFAVENVLDISSFKVSGSNSIAVQGRLDDGSSFLGEIDSAGALTIISKLQTGGISIITPIN